MNELKTAIDIVKYVLKTDERARNNDGYLWARVLDLCGQRDNIDYIHMTIGELLPHVNSMGVPNFETVRRTRQKIQQHHPELGACEKVEAYRAEKEQEFKSFVLGEFKC